MAHDSDSGTMYLGMNEIIEPCPTQFLEVPSHESAIELLQLAAWHIWAIYLHSNFSIIYDGIISYWISPAH